MTFVDWVKWLVGFLCTHLHTHTHTQQFKCAACEILVFYFVVFFLWVASFSIFMHATHFVLFSSCFVFFLHLLPATATAAAEVVWMWHVLPPFISHFVAVCLSLSASASTSACLNLCPYLPQSIPLRDNLSIQLFIFFYCVFPYISAYYGAKFIARICVSHVGLSRLLTNWELTTLIGCI